MRWIYRSSAGQGCGEPCKEAYAIPDLSVKILTGFSKKKNGVVGCGVFSGELCIKVLETGLSSPGPLPCTCLIREGRPHGNGEKDVAVNNQKSILAA